MSTPVAGVTHDLTITDSASVKTGFMLVRDPETGVPLFRRYKAADLATQQYTSGASYANRPTERDLVWEPKSFHRGFGQYRWETDVNKYAQADGVNAVTQGELTLENSLGSVLPVFALDMDMETSGVAQWTSAGSLSGKAKSTSIKYAGSQSLELITSGAGSGSAYLTIADGVPFRSRTITLIGYVRDATTLGQAKLYIDDSVVGASNSGTTTATDTWTFVTVTHTADAATATIRLGCNVIAASKTSYFDSLKMFVTDAVPRDFQEFGGALYMALGACVMKWDETNDKWDAVYVGPAVCSGLAIFESNIYAAFGSSQAYAYSSDGSTWTVSTIAATGKNANFFEWASDSNELWKALLPNTLSTAASAVNGGAWTDYTVGEADRDITNIYALGDGIVVGREDGLWDYNRTGNTFKSVTPEFDRASHADNFARGVAYAGWLYSNTRRGLLRYDGTTVEDVSYLMRAPNFSDFGGRLRAFTIDGNRMWLLVDTPNSDASTTKTTWLMSMRDITIGSNTEFRVHTHWQLSIGDLYGLYVFVDQLYIAGRLFVASSGGTDYYEPVIYRMNVPIRHESPARDVTPALPTSGTQTFITPWWDSDFPDVTKTYRTLAIHCESMTANQTCKVELQLDNYDTDGTGWIYPSSAWTISANGISTLHFSAADLAKRSGKRIRLRFTLATNSATAGPRIIFPFVLHATPRLPVDKTLEFTVYVADNLQLRNKSYEGGTRAAALKAVLDGYIDDNWPQTLDIDEDMDGAAQSYTVYCQEPVLTAIKLDNTTGRPQEWHYRILAVETQV